MKRKDTPYVADYCWVYIAREAVAGAPYTIGIAADLPQLLHDNARRIILYYRQFSSTADGLGHKLLLDTMKGISLEVMIRRMNPAMRNLWDDFRIHPDN